MSAVLSKTAICDACETVAHCSKKGCVPVVTLPARAANRLTRDHAPEIIDSLLGAADQRTRMHRALAPAPTRVASDSLAARLAAQPAPTADTASLCVSFVILVLACAAVAALLVLIAILTGYRP